MKTIFFDGKLIKSASNVKRTQLTTRN